MNNSFHMAVGNSRKHLIQELFDFDALQKCFIQFIHIGLEIFVKVFENQIQLFLINDNIFQPESDFCYITTFLWSIYRRSDIYRMEVDGKPQPSISRLIFFMATTDFVLLSRHRQTRPQAPLPKLQLNYLFLLCWCNLRDYYLQNLNAFVQNIFQLISLIRFELSCQTLLSIPSFSVTIFMPKISKIDTIYQIHDYISLQQHTLCLLQLTITIIITQAANNMSDLTLLFANQSPRSTPVVKIPTAGQNLRNNPFTTRNRILASPNRQSSDIGDNLGKYLKEGLEMENLQQELKKFTSAQKKQLVSTMTLSVFCFSILCYILPIEPRVTFYLGLLFVFEVLPLLAFKLAQEPIFLRGIPIVKPMVYATIIYYLLKSLVGVDLDSFNLDMTLLTVIFTSLRLCIQYYEPIVLIASEDLKHRQIIEKSFIKKISYFPFYCWEKLKLIFNIKGILFSLFFIEMSIFLVLSLHFNSQNWKFIELLSIFYGFLIFFSLEFFIQLCRFLPHLFIEDVKVLVDKVPLYMKLLRLVPRTSYTMAVQKKCLYNLSLKINKVHNFLSTQVCKMSVFKNYMKIFDWYAIKQLEKLHQSIAKGASQVAKHQRAYNKDKSILDDFFILIRKLYARIAQHFEIRQILSVLTSVNSLVKVISFADEQAQSQKDREKVSSRVRELLIMIEQKIRDIQSSSITKNILISQLQVYKRELESVTYCMKNGWTK